MSAAITFPLKDELNENRTKEKSKFKENKMNYIYVNQPSSISKRELPFLGPVRTGEGARD